MSHDLGSYANGNPPEYVKTDAKQLIFPDMHGNTFAFLYRLEAFGVLEIKPEDRRALAGIYAKGENLTPAQQDEFARILRENVVVHPGKYEHLLLAGDLVGDRGLSDLLTVEVLKKLDESKVNYNIIYSNHDLEFILWLLFQSTPVFLMQDTEHPKVSDENHIYLYQDKDGKIFCRMEDKQKNIQTVSLSASQKIIEDEINKLKKESSENIFQPADNPVALKNPKICHAALSDLYSHLIPPILTNFSQRRSLNNLISFVNNYPDKREKIVELINSVYLPKLKLFDYSFNVSNRLKPAIRLMSHAPVGTEAIKAYANYYGVQYDETTPEKVFGVINQLNAKFTEQLHQGYTQVTLPNQTVESRNLLQELCAEAKSDWGDEYTWKNINLTPFLYSAWNRSPDHLMGFLSVLFDLIGTHGHSGNGASIWNQKYGAGSGINLDDGNELGRRGNEPFGKPSDHLCILPNVDDFLSTAITSMSPLTRGESKEDYTKSLEDIGMLNAIRADTEEIKKHLTQFPDNLDKIIRILDYNQQNILSPFFALAIIQKIGEQQMKEQNTNPSYWNTPKYGHASVKAFFEKFKPGCPYAATPPSQPGESPRP